jgi:hypothetical protein
MGGTAPGGFKLAPDERVLNTWRFKESNLVVWIHWNATLTTKRLLVSAPGTFLKVIPMGNEQVSLPLDNLTDAGFIRQIVPLSAIVGVVFLWLGAGSVAKYGVDNLLTWSFVILGLLALMAIIRPYVTIATNRGSGINQKVAVWDRKLAAAFVAEVSDAIASQSQAVQVSNPSAPPSQSASSAMADLVNLRDQGIITTEEYETKRREILARM